MPLCSCLQTQCFFTIISKVLFDQYFCKNKHIDPHHKINVLVDCEGLSSIYFETGSTNVPKMVVLLLFVSSHIQTVDRYKYCCTLLSTFNLFCFACMYLLMTLNITEEIKFTQFMLPDFLLCNIESLLYSMIVLQQSPLIRPSLLQ